jgi:DNA transposition AAA+ family ATPase
MNSLEALRQSQFILTKEYRKFLEFCEACRRERYIGICFGAAGVGKTLSAQYYSRWPLVEALLDEQNDKWLPKISACSTVLYTPSVSNTPSQLRKGLEQAQFDLHRVRYWETKRSRAYDWDEIALWPDAIPRCTDLLIVDEADRLKVSSLEELRDIYDGLHIGLVLIGMPGLERKLARYAQLYSRVGFLHEYKALSQEEMRFIIEKRWQELGFNINPEQFADFEAVSAIVRITSGNFRLLNRLFRQIRRILEINNLREISVEVVEAARDSLVIGA